MIKYFDTHCHLLSDYFSSDEIDWLIKNAKENGVEKIIVPSTNWNNALQALEVAQKYRDVFCAIGIHPSEVKSDFDWNMLEQINVKTIVAVGEIGLDFFWKDNPPFEVQVKVFEKFLDFAVKHDLPALIHMRNSEQTIYEILSQSKYKNLKFLIHCFTSTKQWAEKFILLGGYISFSGIVTFKNAQDLQAIVKSLPLNRILTETDTPYLTPVPFRGQKNQPTYVKHVADFIAKLRDEPFEQVIRVLYKNACDFFKI